MKEKTGRNFTCLREEKKLECRDGGDRIFGLTGLTTKNGKHEPKYCVPLFIGLLDLDYG